MSESSQRNRLFLVSVSTVSCVNKSGELNKALANRFEMFDEPWKERLNEPGKEWEDKWGLMDIGRNLKPGVKIPDCDGKTVS